jgi:polyisoprenoid-binding protein YceI
MQRIVLAIALSASVASVIQAAEYNQVQADQSRIGFRYTQMGVPMDGQFRKFSGQLSFDPAQPTTAKAAIAVDLASIDTGTPEADTEVAGKPWFNTPAFPTARFESVSVKALGDNRYEMVGTLTIKGKTQAVVVPTTFTAQGTTGVFDGAFTIRRGDFAIGEGSWSAFDIVANDIQIKFKLTAKSGS